jgi:hypothetical protein
VKDLAYWCRPWGNNYVVLGVLEAIAEGEDFIGVA